MPAGRPDPLAPSEPLPPGGAPLFEQLCRDMPGGVLIRQGVLAREKALLADLTEP